MIQPGMTHSPEKARNLPFSTTQTQAIGAIYIFIASKPKKAESNNTQKFNQSLQFRKIFRNYTSY